jgi:hypothetical protein
MSYCRTQTVWRDVKVFECAANKNAGSVDRRLESVFAIYEQHPKSLAAE